MNPNFFWLTQEQFSRLPNDTRGKPRLDDRRVISGIIHVPKSGGRRVDDPHVYGPGYESRQEQHPFVHLAAPSR